jgi:hypothetical protein
MTTVSQAMTTSTPDQTTITPSDHHQHARPITIIYPATTISNPHQ